MERNWKEIVGYTFIIVLLVGHLVWAITNVIATEPVNLFRLAVKAATQTR